MKWLRDQIRAWLGIDQQAVVSIHLNALILNEESAREELASLVKRMAETDKGLAQALQAAVAQLNRNTVMMDRWVRSSATLGDIERRHARQEQKAEAVAANGHSRIITPEGL